VCAALLPHGMAVNIRALRERAPQGPALARYGDVARWLTGRAEATPEQGAAWVADLVRRLEIPPLATYGIRPDDLPVLVEKAAKASSMKGNPISLTTSEMTAMLAAAVTSPELLR